MLGTRTLTYARTILEVPLNLSLWSLEVPGRLMAGSARLQSRILRCSTLHERHSRFCGQSSPPQDDSGTSNRREVVLDGLFGARREASPRRGMTRPPPTREWRGSPGGAALPLNPQAPQTALTHHTPPPTTPHRQRGSL